jgi:hypothetical protein
MHAAFAASTLMRPTLGTPILQAEKDLPREPVGTVRPSSLRESAHQEVGREDLPGVVSVRCHRAVHVRRHLHPYVSESDAAVGAPSETAHGEDARDFGRV